MKALACVLLVACSPPPRPKPPPERDAPDAKPVPTAGKKYPAPPAGFATADLVAITGDQTAKTYDLTAYAIVDGKLQATGKTSIAKIDPKESTMLTASIGAGGWVDRDHLFLITGDREVAMVTATAITEIKVPSEDQFNTPKPTDSDDEPVAGDIYGNFFSGTALIVADGAAWWSACPWQSTTPSEPVCQYVHARLWPTAAIETGPKPITPRTFSWVDAPPPGFSVTPGGAKFIQCTASGKTVSLHAHTTPYEEIAWTKWVSASPPRLLVTYGEFNPPRAADRWTLHDGCSETPIATGTTVSPGPGTLWIGREGEGDAVRETLYRGGVAVGVLPPYANIHMRPLKR